MPTASAASPPGPTEPTEPTLLGDLISAASGESNGTIAQVLDKALAKEFAQESKNAEEGKGKTYNETVHSEGGEVRSKRGGSCWCWGTCSDIWRHVPGAQQM